jgi:hypothetical protein
VVCRSGRKFSGKRLYVGAEDRAGDVRNGGLGYCKPKTELVQYGGSGVVENLQVDDDVVLQGLVGRGRDDDGAVGRALVRREVLGGRAGQPGPPLEPSHVPGHMAGIGHRIEPRGILGEDFLGERLAAHIGLGGDARGDGRSLDCRTVRGALGSAAPAFPWSGPTWHGRSLLLLRRKQEMALPAAHPLCLLVGSIFCSRAAPVARTTDDPPLVIGGSAMSLPPYSDSKHFFHFKFLNAVSICGSVSVEETTPALTRASRLEETLPDCETSLLFILLIVPCLGMSFA